MPGLRQRLAGACWMSYRLTAQCCASELVNRVVDRGVKSKDFRCVAFVFLQSIDYGRGIGIPNDRYWQFCWRVLEMADMKLHVRDGSVRHGEYASHRRARGSDQVPRK